jgi:hypothetical protein
MIRANCNKAPYSLMEVADVPEVRNASIIRTLMKDAVRTSETSVYYF